MPERMFPIMIPNYRAFGAITDIRTDAQPFAVVALPWKMLQPHEAQAIHNHGQSLERLAERGGLTPCEALAIIEDRPYRRMLPIDSNRVLAAMVVESVVTKKGVRL